MARRMPDGDDAAHEPKQLAYVALIQKLNERLEHEHHINHKLSHLLHILDAFNETISHLNIQFDFVLENQRGIKFFGIPLFSNRTLLPILDPPNFQSIHEKPVLLSHNTISNYPLPDLMWKWSWETWYVLMYNDVDDQGWVYSNIAFNKAVSDSRWKGKYYTGNFVRRRVWIRMRERGEVPEEPVGKTTLTVGNTHSICMQ